MASVPYSKCSNTDGRVSRRETWPTTPPVPWRTDLRAGGGLPTALKSHKHDDVAAPLGWLPGLHTGVNQLFKRQDQ